MQIQNGTLRFRLGKKITGDNLLGNPNTGSWTDVCTPGKFYRVEFDLADNPATDYGLGIGVAIGGLTPLGDGSPSSPWLEPLDQHYVYDGQCLRGTGLDIAHQAGTGVAINATMYELTWNEPLQYEPEDGNKMKGNIQRNPDLTGVSIAYSSKVTFRKDGFTYINDVYNTHGIGAQIPTLVEYYHAGRGGVGAEWRTLFEGTIAVSSCEFDYYRCLITVDIEDRNASILLKQGEDAAIPFVSRNDGSSPIPGLHLSYIENKVNHFFLHDDTGTNVYISTDYDSAYDDQYYFYNVPRTLQRLVEECTDGAVTFVSDYFSGDDYKDLAITRGMQFVVGAPKADKILKDMSFKQFFDELNKIFNLSYAFEYTDGIPTVRIEDKAEFLHRSPVLTLVNVNGISMSFNISNIFRHIKTGYNDKDQVEGGTIFNYTSVEQSTNQVLDLVGDFIQDSDIIFGQINSGIGGEDYGYGDSLFLIEMDGHNSKQFSVGGRQLYDQSIKGDDNFARWAVTLTGRQWIEGETGKRYYAFNNFERVFRFDYKITYEQFKALQSPGATIVFSGAGVPDPVEALILTVNYDFQTTIAQFQVIA